MPLKDYIKKIWTWYYDADKILTSLRTREGKCKQCGKCCVIFGRKCLFLDKNNRCKIYRFRPTLLCKIPPINLTIGETKKHKDIDCGFYWKEK